MQPRHPEHHLLSRAGWLRAAVLGANDGILSTASLIVGVAAADADRSAVLIAGIAGMVAGAMSMAAGEYVSVSSQSDTEEAELTRERAELAADPEGETQELAEIYVKRGLDPVLAAEVARQFMAADALEAHARDELGMNEITAARPVQAAFSSAASFAVGAALPLATVLIAPPASPPVTVSVAALAFLALLGVAGAKAGGSDPMKGAIRVTFWGALAMGLTYAIGTLSGQVL
ncbi:VIT1/CCC1 transporter family protein [Ancylobacter sp. SL191]|uniref:VIT1/CCC1 transporter family protein n=1 Tax=Ancylobacter sp. SL191 TaxID=2995166 RepID=UPI00226E0859|nr:VIT family protein [Ancylobacter sp. SL191]WAC25652.1 VIT family protein [Ancylobacter sp. SL191]